MLALSPHGGDMRTILILLISIPALAQAIVCTGFHEYMEGHAAKVSSVKLNLEYEDQTTEKYSGDMKDIHFMVIGDKQRASYLLMVSLGPDYTKGVTAGLTWDNNNSMRIARVDGSTVYRLFCQK